MATGVQSWSQTSATNATADAAINFAEGQAPSSVNDSARALMASVAKFRDDQNGSITSTGTSTAYAVTSNQGLSLTQGMFVAFVPHATSGTPATLNVDSLGAKPLRRLPGADLEAGVLLEGTPYTATYYTSNSGEWILHNFHSFSSNPYAIPIGGMLPYVGSLAPNSNFALPYGQAVSRTTYATLFGICGSAFGSGDGSTTFNLPDLRGRSIFGLGNMGGTDASRVTAAASSIDGTTIGATGGVQVITLTSGEQASMSVSGSTGTVVTEASLSQSTQTVQAASGGGSVSVLGTSTSVSATTGTVSTTGTATGGGGAHNNMPPAIILGYALRII